MKNLFILPFIMLLSFTAFAQKTLDKGVIKMELTEASSSNEQMAAIAEMMKGSETVYHFNSENALVTQSFMGGMVSMSSLNNFKTDEATLLFDMMGQKMMVETTAAELDAANSTPEAKAALESMKVEYDKSKTKTILGYTCHNATMKTASGMSVELYVTDDIKANNSLIKGLEGLKFEGFPLELIIDSPEFKMTYTTTEILDKVDPSQLKVDTTGYKKLTMQEFQQTMGAMGGMGF